MKRGFLIGTFFVVSALLGVGSAFGDEAPAVVEASLDVDTATTGDLVTYRLRIEYDKANQVDLPEVAEELGGLRLVEKGVEGPKRAGLFSRRRVVEAWYRLRADLVGSYELPVMEVAVREAPPERTTEAHEGSSQVSTVSSQPLTLVVESVLPSDGSATDIRDIKPLHGAPKAIPWAWVVVAAVLVGLAIALWLYRRRRAGEGVVVPVVPPHLLAYRELDELKERDLADPLAVRRFYFELSETLRRYVEARFGLNATDLTSEEILGALTSSRASRPTRSRRGRGAITRARLELAPEADELLRRFLAETDRVKYAEARPARQEIDASWEHARSFVAATEPELDEANDEADAAVEGERAA